jgi:hypothetical protein
MAKVIRIVAFSRDEETGGETVYDIREIPADTVFTNRNSLTFLPAGAKRRRTVWAEVGYEARRGDRASFWVVNKEGERPEPNELILCDMTDVKMTQAVMSRKYGILMHPDDPDLQNEIDSPIITEKA